MIHDYPSWDRAAKLVDRLDERDALDRLVDDVRAGQSRVLVIRGEFGVGKTTLLDYVSSHSGGCRIARAIGVHSEMELAFAGLHQLCAPFLECLAALPVPQREALRTAFGISVGPAPDRFMVGLAVLSLLSEVAGQQPLVCLVDDAQWLDRASAQVLGFVARRLAAEPVAFIFADRGPGEERSGLPELPVAGLQREYARVLLDSAITGFLDDRVRDRIIAETRGNPLALLELPRGLSPAELAGGFGLPGAVSIPGRIEHSFRRQLDALPDLTRRLLLLAAADPSGDATLVWRAAWRLGIPMHAAEPATEAGLAEFSPWVRFRHPLLRSAAYRSAPLAERRQVHAALGEATGPADPDRRAWHRAQAATGPDEEVAAELERSAGRAQARGGMAAAAAFLERAVALTLDPPRRARRTLTAAQANLRAGAFSKALDLLSTSELGGSGPLDEFASARVDLLRGQISFAAGPGSDAPPLLLKASKRLESLNPDLARETYLDAWHAAMFAGHLAGAGDLLEVSRAARALPAPAHPPRPVDLLLDGLALLATDGPAAAAPVLRQATSAFAGTDIPVPDQLRWGWMAREADKALWGHDGWRATARQVQLARDVGALDRLPLLLNQKALDAVYGGDLASAMSPIAESDTICEATGASVAPYAATMLASYRGLEAEAAPLIRSAIEQAEAGGQGAAATWGYRVTAILCNGLGRHEEALAAARQASGHGHVYVSISALPELIEAAVRTGGTRTASDAVDQLSERTRAGATEDGLGVEARCRALLSEGVAAEGYYREAIDRLGATRLRPELVRARLLYGEWLRRERRRGEARKQLRTACQTFDEMGMEGFAERARRELLATGEEARKRPVKAARGAALTSQEGHVARLARDGLSNPEIATRMFISTRTVQYHLSKVFAKLGIGSRGQLHQVLRDEQL
jgi:DNA-binding CsgD family transcriptional regulator